MKAWVCTELTDPHTIAYRDMPSRPPRGREIQVDIHAAGLNFGETLLVRGKYQIDPSLPYTLGVEGAGVVRACGPETTRLSPGDEVVIHNPSFSEGGGGCFADRIIISEDKVFRKPRVLDFAEAAAFPSNYFTVYNALLQRSRLSPGEVLVVHGATGGIGVAAVQFGKMLGATVIATGGDDSKLEVVKGLGAEHIINYARESVRARVLELTSGRGADVYLDPLGGEVLEESLRAIAPGGRILVFGFMAGTDYAAIPTNLVLVKMISVIGIEAGRFARERPDEYRRAMDDIVQFIEDGKLRPHVGGLYPMADLERAIHDLAGRRIVSKCVVTNSPERPSHRVIR